MTASYPPTSTIPQALTLRDLTIFPPLLNASGAFDIVAADPDWNAEPASCAPLGAYVTKTVTRETRPGNPQPWVEMLSPDTLVNSVGLANVGIARALTEWEELMTALDCPIIVSVGGSGADIAHIIAECESRAPWVCGYELNLSCPNVAGIVAAGDPNLAGAITVQARAMTRRPIIVKLTAACSDISAVARAAEAGGADALTAINTMPVRALNDDAQSLLGSRDGGMSGSGLHPIALRVVAQASAATALPVIGVGGVSTRAGAARMFACGAQAVGVGTAAAIAPSTLGDIAALWGQCGDSENRGFND